MVRDLSRPVALDGANQEISPPPRAVTNAGSETLLLPPGLVWLIGWLRSRLVSRATRAGTCHQEQTYGQVGQFEGARSAARLRDGRVGGGLRRLHLSFSFVSSTSSTALHTKPHRARLDCGAFYFCDCARSFGAKSAGSSQRQRPPYFLCPVAYEICVMKPI